jgi:hypothetical protein
MSDQASKTYSSYGGMKQRCYNPNCSQYKNYGARGITVCDRWLNSYANFVEDMGLKPDGLSLDRIDNDKGYCKENCRWANIKEQRNNQRRCVMLELDGESMCRRDWAKRAGMSEWALKARLNKGLSLRDAISTPIDPEHRKNAYLGNQKRWAKKAIASSAAQEGK